MTGITRWLTQQATKLGTRYPPGRRSRPRRVIEAEKPDVIILATGGHPSHGDVKGADLAVDHLGHAVGCGGARREHPDL